MKKTIILIFLFFSINSIAQYYVEAELHFKDGTINFGLAHIYVFNDKIKFKKHKEDKRISYNHKSISKLILSRDTIKKEFRYKKTLGRRAPKLLELIIQDNNISLYAEILELQMYGLVGAILKIPNKFVYT